jgi:hypothetical protein
MEEQKETIRIDITVTRELHRGIRSAAYRAEMSMSEWIRKAMLEKLARESAG